MENEKLKPIFIDEENGSKMVLCPVCSDLLGENVTVCPNCGAQIDRDEI